MNWRLFLMLLALVLSGCRTAPKNPTPTAWLKPGVQVTLPSPTLPVPVSYQQLLTGRFNGQSQSLLVMMNADGQSLSLAGLSSVGVRLFLVNWDGKTIHTEQSVVTPQLPPASQVLADVMLSHWPISAWTTALPAGWTLTDVGDRRELRDNHGALITRIAYLRRDGQRVPISITQYVFGYQIAIQYLGD